MTSLHIFMAEKSSSMSTSLGVSSLARSWSPLLAIISLNTSVSWIREHSISSSNLLSSSIFPSHNICTAIDRSSSFEITHSHTPPDRWRPVTWNWKAANGILWWQENAISTVRAFSFSWCVASYWVLWPQEYQPIYISCFIWWAVCLWPKHLYLTCQHKFWPCLNSPCGNPKILDLRPFDMANTLIFLWTTI